MEYIRLGNTGMKVSRICLGCMSFGQRAESWPAWALDEDASRPFIQRALELGINFFDTADAYSRGRSEEIVGKALKDFAASRDNVVIASEEEREMFPLCEDQKIGVILWSPRSRKFTACRWRRSRWRGCSRNLWSRPPIIGVTKEYHLDDVAASLDVQLTDDEIKNLEEPYVPQAVVGLD